MHTDSTGTTDSAPSGRRSRLTPEREAELYVATLDLLRETGYAALTMEAIAARAKASKATLYRQWRSKPRLVAAALRHNKGASLVGLDTGSLRGDLYESVHRIAYGAAPDTALLASVAHAILGDPELGLAVREAIVDPEAAVLDRVLANAVARGEVAPDNPAVGLLAHLLIGAVTGRPLIEGCIADEEYLHRYVDAVVLPALLRH